jgi:hypothetical protein
MSLLSKCLKHYPLLEYQVPLRNRLEKSTDDRFKETKNWKGPADANLKRIHFAQVLNRLQLLKVEHVITLVQDLYESLRNIKAKEKKKALTDKVKAAAQMRIILPTYDGVTVGCVVSWIYQQKLHFSDAYQLYQIYQLSDMLGVEALAEICVNKMLSAATESIKLATSQGLGLSALLDQDRDQFPTNENRVDDPLAAIVPMLFTRVLKDGKAPDVLQNLVITSIADSRDLDLFYILKDLFGRSMALDLAEALMKRMCGVTSESRIDVKH